MNFSEVGQYLGNSIGQALFEDERTLAASSAGRLFRLTALAVGGLCLVVGAVGWAASQMLFARGGGPDVARVTLQTFAVALPMWVVGALVWDVNGVAAASAVTYGVQMVLMVRRFRGGRAAAASRAT